MRDCVFFQRALKIHPSDVLAARFGSYLARLRDALNCMTEPAMQDHQLGYRRDGLFI